MSAHDDWVQDVIATVRMVGEDFTEPDDDWAHVLLGWSIDGWTEGGGGSVWSIPER